MDKELDSLDSDDLAREIALQQAKAAVSEREMKRSKQRMEELKKLNLTLDLTTLTDTERTVMARNEKDKGNECFKGAELNQSIYHYSRSLHLDPNNAIVYSNRAMTHLRLKEYSAAESDCGKAIALDPSYVKAWSRRGMALHKRGRYKAAVADFEEALKLQPENKELLKMLNSSRAKYSEAEGELADPRIAEGSKKFSRISIVEDSESESDEYHEVGEERKESSSFNRITIAESDTDSESEDDELMEIIPRRSENTPKVAVPVKESVDIGVKVVKEKLVYSNEDKKMLLEKKIKAAALAADEALKSDTVDKATCAEMVKQHGNALFAAGYFEEAEKSFTRCLQLFPRQSAGYSNRAAVRLKLGAFKEAEFDCTMAIAVDTSAPGSALRLKCTYRRAVARRHLEKYDEALQDVEKVLSFEPENPQALSERAQLHIFLGMKAVEEPAAPVVVEVSVPVVVGVSTAPSVDTPVKLVETSPIEKPTSTREKHVPVVNYVTKESKDTRTHHVNTVVEPAPSSLSAPEFKAKGDLAFKSRKYEEAVLWYSKAVELDQTMLFARLNRAAACLKINRYSEAVDDCNEVLKVESRNVKALHRRGTAHRGLGSVALAINDFESVLALEPTNKASIRELALTRQLLSAPKTEVKVTAATMKVQPVPVDKGVVPGKPSSSVRAEATPAALGKSATSEMNMRMRAIAAADRLKKTKTMVPKAAPKSGYELKRHAHSMRKDPASFASYLRMINPSKMKSLFTRGGFDLELLELSLAAMTEHMDVATEGENVLGFIECFTKLKGFSTAAMMLSKTTANKLDVCFQQLGLNNVGIERIPALKRKYGL